MEAAILFLIPATLFNGCRMQEQAYVIRNNKNKTIPNLIIKANAESKCICNLFNFVPNPDDDFINTSERNSIKWVKIQKEGRRK